MGKFKELNCVYKNIEKCRKKVSTKELIDVLENSRTSCFKMMQGNYEKDEENIKAYIALDEASDMIKNFEKKSDILSTIVAIFLLISIIFCIISTSITFYYKSKFQEQVKYRLNDSYMINYYIKENKSLNEEIERLNNLINAK